MHAEFVNTNVMSFTESETHSVSALVALRLYALNLSGIVPKRA